MGEEAGRVSGVCPHRVGIVTETVRDKQGRGSGTCKVEYTRYRGRVGIPRRYVQ